MRAGRTLALAVLLALAGCGGEESANPTSAATQEVAVEEAAETTAEEVTEVAAEDPTPQPELAGAGRPVTHAEVVTDWTVVHSENTSTFFRVLRINNVCFVEHHGHAVIPVPAACEQ